MVSIIFITLGFEILKKEESVKENKEVKELIDKMDASFDLLPFELSDQEKFEFIKHPETIIDIHEKQTKATPDAPNWNCASLCWSQFSNCWNGLSYYEQGSEKWIKGVNKCFSSVTKCYKKCRKEKNVGGPIQ